MFRFFRQQKRRRAIKKVKAGDGHTLKPYRLWHIFTHSLFHITITKENNEQVNYALKSRYFADDSSVDLYHARLMLPTRLYPPRSRLRMAYSRLKVAAAALIKFAT